MVKVPEVALLNALGFQTRVVDKDYDVKKNVGGVMQDEKMMRARASEIRKNWKNMDDEERIKARDSIRKDWGDAGLNPQGLPPWVGPPRPPKESMKRTLEQRENR